MLELSKHCVDSSAVHGDFIVPGAFRLRSTDRLFTVSGLESVKCLSSFLQLKNRSIAV